MIENLSLSIDVLIFSLWSSQIFHQVLLYMHCTVGWSSNSATMRDQIWMYVASVKTLNLKEAEKWSFKSKIWKPKISSFVIKKPYFNFLSTNKQYVKIKLMQNETNLWSIFFGKDEIFVKLWFKGLNYHNFHIFYHN